MTILSSCHTEQTAVLMTGMALQLRQETVTRYTQTLMPQKYRQTSWPIVSICETDMVSGFQVDKVMLKTEQFQCQNFFRANIIAPVSRKPDRRLSMENILSTSFSKRAITVIVLPIAGICIVKNFYKRCFDNVAKEETAVTDVTITIKPQKQEVTSPFGKMPIDLRTQRQCVSLSVPGIR